MLLQNRLQHMKGKAVLVNGSLYHIGQDLVICDDQGKHQDVPDADSKKLLANRESWLPFDPNKASKALPVASERPRIQLVTTAGDVIPPPPVISPVPQPVAATEVTPKPVVVPETIQDPPIPKKGEDWADPKLGYSMAWLHACAKAYKIPYKGKTKAALIEKIKTAMYG